MAISYLANIDLSNNQLKDFKVDNVTSDPQGLAGEGQLIYRTDLDVLKYHTGSNNWVTVGTGSGSGSVTSVNVVTDGTSLDVPSNSITTNGTMTLVWQGSSSQYVNGEGDLVTFPTIPQGDITEVEAGTYLNGGGTSGDVTLNHDLTARTDTGSSVSPGYGGTITVIGSVSTNTTGHVTAVDVETITFPSAENYSFTLDADSGTSQLIAKGDTLTINGTANNISTVVGATDTVTIDLDDTAVTAGSYTSANITVDAKGRITAASDGGGGTMTSWTLAGSSGTSQTITNGNTASFLQGNGITTVASATDTLTITNVKPFDSITLAASAGSNSTITNQDTITIAAGSNISTTNNGSGTVTIAYTGGTGSMSSFSLAGDTGTTQTISNGDTVSILGSVGIDTVASATDTVTVNLDLAELNTVTTVDEDSDFLVGVDGTANEKILYSNVHVNQWGDAEGVVNMGTSGNENRIKHLQAGSDATDAVNVAQLNAAIAGVGLFQGGYNANTGLTTDLSTNGSLDGASNIALDKGDFFVVTTAGSAFYSETLEVGDMIYANQDITASSNPAQSVYTVVIADENIAGAGSTDGGTQKGVAGFDSGNFGVTANGWVTLDNTGVSAGSYGSASKSLSATVTAKGLLTSLSEQNIAITASQVTDFCNAVDTCVADNSLTALIGNGSATTYTIDVSSLNTRDLMVQCYRNGTPYDTVHLDVERTSTSVLTLRSQTALSTNQVKVLVTKIT